VTETAQIDSRQTTTDARLRDFANLLVGMSRLLTGLGSIGPFGDGEIGVTEWVALSVLANEPEKNNRQLAKVLGVTRQRANQIKTSLERARLISAIQSSEDARQNVITVTERGRSQLEAMNSELLSILVSSLQNKERVLTRANKSIKVLMRIVRVEKEAKSPGSRHRKAGRNKRPRSAAGTRSE
jgi:DNA-binding MarR family transcriptional regulator